MEARKHEEHKGAAPKINAFSSFIYFPKLPKTIYSATVPFFCKRVYHLSTHFFFWGDFLSMLKGNYVLRLLARCFLPAFKVTKGSSFFLLQKKREDCYRFTRHRTATTSVGQ
jgi:hypothetical protein